MENKMQEAELEYCGHKNSKQRTSINETFCEGYRAGCEQFQQQADKLAKKLESVEFVLRMINQDAKEKDTYASIELRSRDIKREVDQSLRDYKEEKEKFTKITEVNKLIASMATTTCKYFRSKEICWFEKCERCRSIEKEIGGKK